MIQYSAFVFFPSVLLSYDYIYIRPNIFRYINKHETHFDLWNRKW